MIVKQNLNDFLTRVKIVFEHGLYKYVVKAKERSFELYPKPKLNLNKNLLFKDISIDYLRNRKLTKDTLKGYKSQLKFNILPYFGEIQINKITYEMIVDFMQKMKEKYKPKTASNGVTLLGSILKYAFEQGLIKHNPYYGVKNSMCK